MQNSRLIVLCQILSKKEIRDFRKYIATPFFNQRADVIQLFEYLAECLFEYDIIPDKEQIHRKVYPDQAYSDHQVRLILSFCFKHLDQFLIHQAYFSDKVKSKIKLLEAYRKRNLSKHFQRSMEDVWKMHQKSAVRNADYFNDSLQILQEEYQYTSTSQRTGAQNLQRISDNMDIAYFTLKLRQTCLSLSHQAVYNTEYHFGMVEEVVHYIEAQKLLNIPAIAIYYYCYKALTQPNQTQYFEQLKKTLFEKHQLFPETEMRDLFLLTINYCIKRINKGHQRFEKEVLDLYKEGLRQEYLMTNGLLSRFTYQNICSIALKLKDYDWVGQFNPQYKDRLEKQYRESAYSYNMARLEYARKNYSAVLDLLQKSNFKDLLINLDAKAIALKTYYELEEITLLQSHLDAMKNFIHRKKIMAYHRESYLILIYFTRQLLELNSFDRTARQQLLAEVEGTKAMAQKAWVLEQIRGPIAR